MNYIVHQAPLSMGIPQARILEWVALPSSRESSQTRDWTQVFHIAGGFFTVWAAREAQEYGIGEPVPSPGELPDPGIKAGSPALQADSLPAELLGKLKDVHFIQLFYQVTIFVSLGKEKLHNYWRK